MNTHVVTATAATTTQQITSTSTPTVASIDIISNSSNNVVNVKDNVVDNTSNDDDAHHHQYRYKKQRKTQQQNIIIKNNNENENELAINNINICTEDTSFEIDETDEEENDDDLLVAAAHSRPLNTNTKTPTKNKRKHYKIKAMMANTPTTNLSTTITTKTTTPPSKPPGILEAKELESSGDVDGDGGDGTHQLQLRRRQQQQQQQHATNSKINEIKRGKIAVTDAAPMAPMGTTQETSTATAAAPTFTNTTSIKLNTKQHESSFNTNFHCQRCAAVDVEDDEDDDEADIDDDVTDVNIANKRRQQQQQQTQQRCYCNADDDDDDDDAVICHAEPKQTIAETQAEIELMVHQQQQQQHNIPLVDIIRDDSGEQSDISLESSNEDTDSSTPTTADIADITINSMNSTIYLVAKRNITRSPLQQQQKTKANDNSRLNIFGGSGGNGVDGGVASEGMLHNNNHNNNNSNNGSIADDNLSASIATTTTDVDTDNITVASPNMSLTTASTTRLNTVIRSAQTFLNSTTAAAVNSNQMIAADAGAGVCITSCHHHYHQHQHPSAAYLQSAGDASNTAIVQTTGHKRTLSAASYRSTASQHPSLSAVSVRSVHSRFYNWIRWFCLYFKSSGIGEPSVYHALVVIFLEFFAWGLLTMPVISVLNQTFPDHTFLMNGLVMGIKGILSFLSAPLIGALSDIWGRKFFLLITVFFTCAPIPLMTINSWWFFAMISISGIFAVTFSVVFAYVADVTTVEERSRAYGLVSATFAASLVISPALGAALMEMYSDTLVVALATAIAVLDVFFILVAVPESLPEKVRPSSWGAPISWEQADPFAALRKVGTDHTILMQCVTVLLSYLPEAGQYSCIFVYLKLKMGFNSMEVAIFIAVVGILSISIQVTLGYLMRVLGAKRTIVLGLVLEMLQLLWYGFGSQKWMMWAAGVLAALGSITYPAISAFVSIHSTPDRQGAVQGMVTGMRGLCNGLGPAMFGVIFYLFNVDLNDEHVGAHVVGGGAHDLHGAAAYKSEKYAKFIPGPPFVFGALMVILAILVAIFIPEGRSEIVGLNRAPSEKKRKNRISLDVQYEIETGHKATGPLAPLMRSDSLAQL